MRASHGGQQYSLWALSGQPNVALLPGELASQLGLSGRTLRALQVRSSGAQQAVQQEVEKLQMQSGAAAGLAPPRAEPGNAGTHLGRGTFHLPRCHTYPPEAPNPPETTSKPLSNPTFLGWWNTCDAWVRCMRYK